MRSVFGLALAAIAATLVLGFSPGHADDSSRKPPPAPVPAQPAHGDVARPPVPVSLPAVPFPTPQPAAPVDRTAAAGDSSTAAPVRAPARTGPPTSPLPTEPPSSKTFLTFESDSGRILLRSLERDSAFVICRQVWAARGAFDGRRFTGSWIPAPRPPAKQPDQTASRGEPVRRVPLGDLFTPALSASRSRLTFEIRSDGGVEAVFGGMNGDTMRIEHWKKPPPPPPDIEVPPPAGETPKFGEYVYVEELPEATTKVAAIYPEAARRQSIDGTVMVQALIGKDGKVRDTKVVRSIPGLDEAAVASVRQWIFKPALSKHEPVEVWVAVPVKFALH